MFIMPSVLCRACGTLLPVDRDHIPACDRDDSYYYSDVSPPNWNIHCSVSDFNKVHFSDPWVWSSFIRVSKFVQLSN